MLGLMPDAAAAVVVDDDDDGPGGGAYAKRHFTQTHTRSHAPDRDAVPDIHHNIFARSNMSIHTRCELAVGGTVILGGGG